MALMDADLWGAQNSDGRKYGYFWTEGLGTGLLWFEDMTAEATSGPNRLGNNPGNYAAFFLGGALVKDGLAVSEPGNLALVCAALLALIGASRRQRG